MKRAFIQLVLSVDLDQVKGNFDSPEDFVTVLEQGSSGISHYKPKLVTQKTKVYKYIFSEKKGEYVLPWELYEVGDKVEFKHGSRYLKGVIHCWQSSIGGFDGQEGYSVKVENRGQYYVTNMHDFRQNKGEVKRELAVGDKTFNLEAGEGVITIIVEGEGEDKEFVCIKFANRRAETVVDTCELTWVESENRWEYGEL